MLVPTGVSKLGADLLVWVSCDKRLRSPLTPTPGVTGVCLQAHPGLEGVSVLGTQSSGID